MNAPFKVGDICVGRNLGPMYTGMECEIVAGLERGMLLWKKESPERAFIGSAYKVKWANGIEIYQLPYQLMRKSDPSFDTWAAAKVVDLVTDAKIVNVEELMNAKRALERAA